MTKKNVADVVVENHGSIFSFMPVTKAAKAWIEENVETEGWQWLCGALCVEPRMARDLADGMVSAGLSIE